MTVATAVAPYIHTHMHTIPYKTMRETQKLPIIEGMKPVQLGFNFAFNILLTIYQ